jgi:acetylornithine deacetylase/succinyl-diaminopimelate desuccinylase-like protein
MDFVESCRRLIAADSSPTQGSREVVEFLKNVALEKNLTVEIMSDVSGDQNEANIFIRKKTETAGAKDFLLQAHLDTPDPGPFAMWKNTGLNPFDAHIISGAIYGLGTADVKLDILCKIEALSQVSESKNGKRNPVVLATYGEESRMVGAMKAIRKGKIKADLALIGEPSDLRLLTAGKGMATVEISIPFSEEESAYRETHNLQESMSTQSRIFNGQAAHSSNPQQGESAIKKMFDYLMKMPTGLALMEISGGISFNSVPAHAFLEFDLVSNIKDPMSEKLTKIYTAILKLEEEFIYFKDEDFTPPHPTLNIGLLQSASDHVLLSGTCRIPPSFKHEDYEKWMSFLDQVCSSVGAHFRIVDYKRPFRTGENSTFVSDCKAILKDMGLGSDLGTHSSTNEASLFSRVGVSCISFGPGKRERNIHTPDEHVLISDLERAIDFYKRAIERFCL